MPSFKESFEQTTQRIFHYLTTQSSPDSSSIDYLRALEVFYNLKRDSGKAQDMMAVPFQKIIVVHKGALKKGQVLYVTYQNSSRRMTLTAVVKRVNEYSNHSSEFGKPSDTVLIAWHNGPEYIDTISELKLKDTDTDIRLLGAARAYFNNFIINPRPPGSEPDPPIDAAFLAGIMDLSFPIAKSDYSNANHQTLEVIPYSVFPETIKVVVSDTGLKINLGTDANRYPTNMGTEAQFPITSHPDRDVPNRVGFCSLTNYLDDAYLNSNAPAERKASFPEGIEQNDAKVLSNPHDDHPQRHGTFISAIIGQNTIGNAQIIPLKIFDFLGIGTLFDILCGFNYIFNRIAAGENIRVVNASWGGYTYNRVNFDLLEKKVEVLRTLHVFLICSAGNRESLLDINGNSVDVRNQPNKYDLSRYSIYPACYSDKYDNVIAVTTIAEEWGETVSTVTPPLSAYSDTPLRDKLLSYQSTLSEFLKMKPGISPIGYRPVERYSSNFVQVGVVAHPIGGLFPTPFGGKRQLPIMGSSFAAAFMSAYVVNFLKSQSNPQTVTRQDILASLPIHSSLKPYIHGQHYLELSAINHRTTQNNFESVLRTINQS